MGANDQECDTELGLGIRGHFNGRPSSPPQLDLIPLACVFRDSSSLQIFPCTNNSSDEGYANKFPLATCCSNQYEDTHNNNYNMVSSANSTGSCFHADSNVIDPEAAVGIKRKRDGVTEKDFEGERAYCRVSEEEEEGSGGTRKKLRLLKQQSAFLEENFKQNSTLNPKQKQALAKHLNLSPRQVEVWFQNRRARTKLKQTEVDCEFLKGCYESLTEENKRLQRELLELRSLKLAAAASPLYMQFPSPTLTMCPSCERVVTSDNTRPFTSVQKTYFHPSYTHSSSVAC